LAFDAGRDELYVAGFTAVSVFTRTASNSDAPLRTLNISVVALAFDAAHDQLAGASYANRVLVYDRAATGSDPALFSITGADFSQVSSLAYDSTHGELFAGDTRRVLVLESNLGGTVAPLREISGDYFGFGTSGPAGVAVDRVAGEIFVAG